MEANTIIENTIGFVKTQMAGAEGGHDWWHVYRVWKLSCKLLETEKADRLVCELAALLHDIADPKFNNGDEDAGPLIASEFLGKAGLSQKRTGQVIDIIKNISFKGGHNSTQTKSLELQVVQDADRLDAMGAIGIARAFSYGGFRSRKLYDPEILPLKYNSPEEYRKSDSPTLNHFHEKLLLLKDLMNTKTAKQMAERRHDYMLAYIEEFHREWEGLE